MQQSRTRAFQPKKDTGECFSTKMKSTCKNSGTFERKKKLLEKVTSVPLAPSHSIIHEISHNINFNNKWCQSILICPQGFLEQNGHTKDFVHN